MTDDQIYTSGKKFILAQGYQSVKEGAPTMADAIPNAGGVLLDDFALKDISQTYLPKFIPYFGQSGKEKILAWAADFTGLSLGFLATHGFKNVSTCVGKGFFTSLGMMMLDKIK